MPRMAAIAPTPTGTACCIAWARKRTSGAAWASVRTPEATSAEYSPSEWPAITDGSAPPSASQARQAATPATSITGWVLVVSAKFFLGAFVDQVRDVLVKCVGRLAQGFGHRRVIAPGVEHADGLRTLAGKDESEGLHGCCLRIGAAPGARRRLSINS